MTPKDTKRKARVILQSFQMTNIKTQDMKNEVKTRYYIFINLDS